MEKKKNMSNVVAILNRNVVIDKNKEQEIVAMGMSACQARCISCTCCSSCCGKHH